MSDLIVAAEVNVCSVCQQAIAPSPWEFTTGYGVNSDGDKICYSCCADGDREYMRQHGKIALYLCHDKEARKYTVTNWPGTVCFPIMGHAPCRSWHNIARYRYDVWFVFDGHIWHGIQYGDNTQIVHCRRTKQEYR